MYDIPISYQYSRLYSLVVLPQLIVTASKDEITVIDFALEGEFQLQLSSYIDDFCFIGTAPAPARREPPALVPDGPALRKGPPALVADDQPAPPPPIVGNLEKETTYQV